MAAHPNILYNQAIKWVLHIALPRMENNHHELMQVMIAYHHGYATTAANAYNNLSDDIDDRVKGLLKIISFLNEKIGWYEGEEY